MLAGMLCSQSSPQLHSNLSTNTTRRRWCGGTQLCQQATSKRWWCGCPGQRMLAGMSCSRISPRLHSNLSTGHIKRRWRGCPGHRMLAGMVLSGQPLAAPINHKTPSKCRWCGCPNHADRHDRGRGWPARPSRLRGVLPLAARGPNLQLFLSATAVEDGPQALDSPVAPARGYAPRQQQLCILRSYKGAGGAAALKSVNQPHQSAGGVVAQGKGGLQRCPVLKTTLGSTRICQLATSSTCWPCDCPGQRMLAGMSCSQKQPSQATSNCRWCGCPGQRMLAGMSCFQSSPRLHLNLSTGHLKLLVVWLPRTKDACRDVMLLEQPSAAHQPVNKLRRGAGGATMLKSVSKPHQGAGGAVAQDKDACRDVVFSNQRSAALNSVNRPHETAGGVVAQDKGCLQGGRVHNAGGVVVQDKRGLQGCCALKAALGCTPTCQQITTRRRRRNNAQISQQATPKRRWRGGLGPRMLAGMSCFPNSESLARQASRWASLVASTTSFRPPRKRDTQGAFRGACVGRLTARPDPLKPAGADGEMPGQLMRGKKWK